MNFMNYLTLGACGFPLCSTTPSAPHPLIFSTTTTANAPPLIPFRNLKQNADWLESNLSPDERAMLIQHTHDTSVWNDVIQRDRYHALLDRMPGMGIELELYSGAEKPLSAIPLGGPLKLPYFTSSYLRNVAEEYAGALDAKDAGLFVLRIPVGSKVVCLDKISVHGDREGEVLLDAWSTLQVTQIESRTHPYTVVHATLVPWFIFI